MTKKFVWNKRENYKNALEFWEIRIGEGILPCSVYIQQNSLGYYIAVGSFKGFSKSFVGSNLEDVRNEAMKWVERILNQSKIKKG
jgi:hypothetical protein